MKEREFTSYLDNHNTEYDYMRGDYEGQMGIYIKNKRFDTDVHIAYATIESQDLDTLIRATHMGRNVDQITRVTGFFSKASAWNKGKKGELEDRYRSRL